MEFKALTPLDEAVNVLTKNVRRLDVEEVSIYECRGRVLAEDVVAGVDVPPFDRAAMDGYAVIAEDTFGADEDSPVRLRVIGRVEAGENPSLELKRGEAVEIATGAAMPKNANAVVMVEHTRRSGDFVEVFKAVPPLKNVSRRGEDVKSGEVVLKKGEILQPQDAGVLASIGVSRVKVFRKPRVAVISTGNELVKPGEELEFGKIYCSNDAAIANALSFAEPVRLGIVRDEEEEIERVLLKALDCDAVIFTGGSSVGKRDLVPRVVERYARVLFHGVAMRPGMPSGAAVVDGKPVFMLPGSPAAALLSFHAIVEPALFAMMGVRVLRRRGEKVRGTLASPVASQLGVRSFVRVLWDNGKVYPVRVSGSSILSSMVRANALLVIPENVEGFAEGEEVEVTLIRDLTEVLE
ncbi:MAG: gephyrin-like molybdotransferase Glp [Archaeoglobaceae archaeon]